MTIMTPEEISKLPKWAQSKFQVMQQDYNSLLSKYNALTGVEETRISLDIFSQGMVRYLRENTHVFFTLDSGWIEVSITDEGRVGVRAERELSIRPESWNKISITNQDQ